MPLSGRKDGPLLTPGGHLIGVKLRGAVIDQLVALGGEGGWRVDVGAAGEFVAGDGAGTFAACEGEGIA